MQLGMIGLGRMGSAIAGRVADAGFDLIVWNRSPDKAATKSLMLMLPSTRSPRQSNCPVAAKEREIDGHASDRSISPSVSDR